MNKYTDKQIEDTLKLIDSTILNCEKIAAIQLNAAKRNELKISSMNFYVIFNSFLI